MNHKSGQQEQTPNEDGRTPYEPPAIIYKGKISTRAGSPVSFPEGDTSVVDPADLFGDD